MENNQRNSTAKTTPRDVFMHLLAFVALYVSVVSLIALAFQYINVWQQDPLNFYYQGILDIVRRSMASLLVMFPVYILMTWLINRDFRQEPDRRDLKIRKWLVYLTLFVAAITIIIDIITLIYNFLGGELTLSFVLKILVVLLVALAVFGYYFKDLRGGGVSRKNNKILAWIAGGAALIVIAAGFFVVGTPGKQRQYRFDEQRVVDLQAIQYEIINYWTQKEVLPATLADLKNSISGFTPAVDPKTGAAYEYNIKSALVFELCGQFNLPSLASVEVGYRDYPVKQSLGPYSPDQNWSHKAGRTCFERAIDPDLYRLPKSVPID